jgi:hypothetical protein
MIASAAARTPCKTRSRRSPATGRKTPSTASPDHCQADRKRYPTRLLQLGEEHLVTEQNIAVRAGARARIFEHALLREKRCLGIEKRHERTALGDGLGAAEQIEKAHESRFFPLRRASLSF